MTTISHQMEARILTIHTQRLGSAVLLAIHGLTLRLNGLLNMAVLAVV